MVGLRLPGHGTAPSGLLTFEIEDMAAAVRMAMRDLRAQLGPGKPIYMIGYSNGAALSVSYSLAILEGTGRRRSRQAWCWCRPPLRFRRWRQ